MEYAKALETEVNAVLRTLMRRAYGNANINHRMAHVEGRPLDLGTPFPHQGIGALRKLLLDEPLVKKGLDAVAREHTKHLTDPYKLPRQLEKVQKLRNPAAHAEPVSREELLRLRDEVMGIGQTGVLSELVWRKEGG